VKTVPFLYIKLSTLVLSSTASFVADIWHVQEKWEIYNAF